MKTIEFYSEIPGLAEIVPIIPAKDYTAKWMLAARQEYIDMLKSSQLNSTHIYQCPGIFDLFNQGWIVPMWHDVLIKTESDKNSFAYMYPSDDIVNSLSGREPVSRHADELAKFIPKRPWSLNPVIKFNTPWHIVDPKGVKFIVSWLGEVTVLTPLSPKRWSILYPLLPPSGKSFFAPFILFL